MSYFFRYRLQKFFKTTFSAGLGSKLGYAAASPAIAYPSIIGHGGYGGYDAHGLGYGYGAPAIASYGAVPAAYVKQAPAAIIKHVEEGHLEHYVSYVSL